MSKFFYVQTAMIVAVFVLVSCDSSDGTSTGSDETVTITGTLNIGNISTGPESPGTPVENGTVFVEGVEGTATTDADGNFSYDVPLSGSLNGALASLSGLRDAPALGDSTRFFAWKDYSDFSDEYPEWNQTKLGTASGITIDDDVIDMGTLELVFTCAVHFRVKLPDGVNEYPSGVAYVEGISQLPEANINTENGNFDIEYLPSGQDYTIVIEADGYETIEYEFVDWPVCPEGNDEWIFLRTDSVNPLPELTPL